MASERYRITQTADKINELLQTAEFTGLDEQSEPAAGDLLLLRDVTDSVYKKLAYSTLQGLIRALTLTGLEAGSADDIAATDTLLEALAKLQAQLTEIYGYDPDTAVQETRQVNGHALSADVTVTASDIGLGNVTNESKTTMFASPTFTGTPTAPTQTSGDDTTALATTAFVQDAIESVGGTQFYSGSYTGTGVYGSSDPNSIVFSFEPKFVFIKNRTLGGEAYWHFFTNVPNMSATNSSFIYHYGTTGVNTTEVCTYTAATFTLEWYNTSNAMSQLNASGTTYDVIAIG